jgi:hypothetical protein
MVTAAPVQEPEAEANKEERLIIQSTGIDDLELIRRTMVTFNQDIDAVYDYLFSLVEIERANERAGDSLSIEGDPPSSDAAQEPETTTIEPEHPQHLQVPVEPLQ